MASDDRIVRCDAPDRRIVTMTESALTNCLTAVMVGNQVYERCEDCVRER
jgi:hypothetical protein